MSTEIPSKPLCYAPFYNVYLRASSQETRVCCMNTSHHRLESNDMSEVFNNTTAQGIRKQMLANEWPTSCSQCKSREDHGLESDRNMFDAWHESAVENGTIDGDEPLDLVMPDPRWADIRPSNLCNLKCRMCYPDNSTEVAREWAKLQSPINDVTLHNDWAPKQLAELSKREHYELPQLDNITNIKLLGGEPTVQKEVVSILESLTYNPYSKVDITTNASSTGQFALLEPHLKNFGSVGWTVSIDGTEQEFEYIRTPAKWARFNQAVDYLCSKQWGNSDRSNNTTVQFHFVLQAWNWSSLHDVVKYCEEMRKEYATAESPHGHCGLTIQPVDQPWLGMAVIPIVEREREIALLEKNFPRRCGELKKWSASTPYDPELAKQFRAYTQLLDESRDTSFNEINPMIW